MNIFKQNFCTFPAELIFEDHRIDFLCNGRSGVYLQSESARANKPQSFVYLIATFASLPRSFVH